MRVTKKLHAPAGKQDDVCSVTWVPVQFNSRTTLCFDEDVLELLNTAAKRAAWVNRTHLLNAALRKALAPLAPPGFRLRFDQFAELALKRHKAIKVTRK